MLSEGLMFFVAAYLFGRLRLAADADGAKRLASTFDLAGFWCFAFGLGALALALILKFL